MVGADGGFDVPRTYQDFQDAWQQGDRGRAHLERYARGEISFVPNLLPEQAVNLPGDEVVRLLRRRLGEAFDLAVHPEHGDPERPGALPAALRSPVADEADGSWLKRANMVGINVRTIGSFWNIVKYALTLPAAQDAIQILPIWEAGVVGSMYGISSWELNREFYSAELAGLYPHLNSTGRQLRVVVHLLHALGKRVGMDVIPHTDRYSEIALAHPAYFEWLQRQDTVIIDHRADLHEAVQARIYAFLSENGPALSGEKLPASRDAFFSEQVPEAQRLRLLFGRPDDPMGREGRRIQLIKYLYRYGYEPVPGTMAPPYRGLKVDTREEARIVDENGLVWRDYLITHPQPMSRVFGPLARFKLYERRDDNRNWEIDFERPRPPVWNYVCERYAEVQARYGFDFMRGDMAHVQMRPQGVPPVVDRYYDILGAVKQFIRGQGVPYFGYFAETFIPPRDVMAYGEEMDHLEASAADSTLGDLQSTTVGSAVFLQRLRLYDDMLRSRRCAPNFTVMTADKDDPRFDEFYLAGNEVRLFIALCLTDMPSYMGLGFETRESHHRPAPNEHYSKLFVFQERIGPKATHGPYVWGRNGFLFHNLTRLKIYLDAIWPAIQGRPCRWLLAPDATGERKTIAWTQAGAAPRLVFIANTDTENPAAAFGLPLPDSTGTLRCEFSSAQFVSAHDRTLTPNGYHYPVSRLEPGEARIYRLET